VSVGKETIDCNMFDICIVYVLYKGLATCCYTMTCAKKNLRTKKSGYSGIKIKLFFRRRYFFTTSGLTTE
jgi:hypothetical protein